MIKVKKFLPNLSANIILGIAALIILLPLFLVVNTALKSPSEFQLAPTSLVHQPILDNFIIAWNKVQMGRYLFNSLAYTTSTVLLVCLVATMAAYPIARNHFRFSSALYVFFLSGLFLPGSLVTLIYLMKYLKLINTQWGYVILKIAGGLPLTIFILSGFIRSIPRELDEAAVMDGCGYFQFIFSILFPLIQPALATVAIFIAIGVWNDFLDPFIYLSNANLRPVTTGLFVFFGEYSTDWTTLTAAILMITLPLIVIFIFFQRYIISSLVSGAVKG
jgi:raffinose/stachyose/melibiose transport system permease protein